MMSPLKVLLSIISLFVVMFIVPSFFVLFDKIIVKTSRGFIDKSRSGSI